MFPVDKNSETWGKKITNFAPESEILPQYFGVMSIFRIFTSIWIFLYEEKSLQSFKES